MVVAAIAVFVAGWELLRLPTLLGCTVVAREVAERQALVQGVPEIGPSFARLCQQGQQQDCGRERRRGIHSIQALDLGRALRLLDAVALQERLPRRPRCILLGQSHILRSIRPVSNLHLLCRRLGVGLLLGRKALRRSVLCTRTGPLPGRWVAPSVSVSAIPGVFLDAIPASAFQLLCSVCTHLFNVGSWDQAFRFILIVIQGLLLGLPPVIFRTLFQHKEEVSFGDSQLSLTQRCIVVDGPVYSEKRHDDGGASIGRR